MNALRRVTSVAALALVTAGLGVVAAPSATAAAPAFAWEISQQFDDHLSTHELSDGATEDAAGVVTFPNGAGGVDPETGAGTIQYEGSIEGSFVVGVVTYYQVTIADPAVTVDDEGNGEITAVVSASNAAAMGNPAESTDPARVVVTTFDAEGGWGSGSLAATPHWAGVLPEGAESTALAIPAGQPVDGKAFSPEFLGQITKGVRPHFYASGSSSDAKKAPASFTASAVVGKSVDVDATYGVSGVRFHLEGTGGFTATDGGPGDDGVYVGLAPSGGLPPVDDMAGDFSNFAAANWVTGDEIQDGGFVTSMTAEGQFLKPGTEYSVYTWRAHEHSSTSQDTETPVTIDWAALTGAVKVQPKPGKLAVSVTGPSGKAEGVAVVKLTKGGKTKTLDGALLKEGTGKATVKLPKLAKGKWKATVSYFGSTYTNAKKVLTLKVK